MNARARERVKERDAISRCWYYYYRYIICIPYTMFMNVRNVHRDKKIDKNREHIVHS